MTPTQIFAYSWIIGNQTDGAQGMLYAGHSSRNGRLRRRGEMNEHEIVAMIATILEFLKSNETPYANYIAIRYRDNLRIAQQQVLPGMPGL